MEVSRVKQLQQLSESLIKITLPKLNHQMSNPLAQYQIQSEKLMLIILDMLKQFLYYCKTPASSTPKYHSILFEQEKVVIKQRIILYMIQMINISDLNFDSQMSLLVGANFGAGSTPDGLFQYKYFKEIKVIISEFKQSAHQRAEEVFWLEDQLNMVNEKLSLI